MAIWYHASPAGNRASVMARGLLGTRTIGDGMMSVFAIAGQPRALYLAPTLEEARRYVDHVFARFFPDAVNPANADAYLARGARLAAFDIWAVDVGDEPLATDEDWPGTAAWTRAGFAVDRLRLVETRDLRDWKGPRAR